MVEFKDVSVTYATGVDALENVNVKINDGDLAFIVGPSGAGKSTLIKLVLKEIDPTEGNVLVNGYDLSKLKKRDIPHLRRTIGFVFQDFRLIQSMTVGENIAFVLRVIDAPKSYIKKRVKYVVSLVGLEDKVDAFPDELSGGEMQRTAIARALVNDPKLIICDEPTGNIDPELSYEIIDLLREINASGTTMIIVTHEHDLVRHFGGRIININKGIVTFDRFMAGETVISPSIPANVAPIKEEETVNPQDVLPNEETYEKVDVDTGDDYSSASYDDAGTDYTDDSVYSAPEKTEETKIPQPETQKPKSKHEYADDPYATAAEGLLEKHSRSMYAAGVSVNKSKHEADSSTANTDDSNSDAQPQDDGLFYSDSQYDPAGDIMDTASRTYKPRHSRED